MLSVGVSVAKPSAADATAVSSGPEISTLEEATVILEQFKPWPESVAFAIIEVAMFVELTKVPLLISVEFPASPLQLSVELRA